jgi:hypothetical protein
MTPEDEQVNMKLRNLWTSGDNLTVSYERILDELEFKISQLNELKYAMYVAADIINVTSTRLVVDVNACGLSNSILDEENPNQEYECLLPEVVLVNDETFEKVLIADSEKSVSEANVYTDRTVYVNTEETAYVSANMNAEDTAYIHAVRPAYAHADRPAYTHADRPAYIHADRPAYAHADRPAYVHADRPAYIHADRPAFVHADRPAYVDVITVGNTAVDIITVSSAGDGSVDDIFNNTVEDNTAADKTVVVDGNWILCCLEEFAVFNFGAAVNLNNIASKFWKRRKIFLDFTTPLGEVGVKNCYCSVLMIGNSFLITVVISIKHKETDPDVDLQSFKCSKAFKDELLVYYPEQDNVTPEKQWSFVW